MSNLPDLPKVTRQLATAYANVIAVATEEVKSLKGVKAPQTQAERDDLYSRLRKAKSAVAAVEAQRKILTKPLDDAKKVIMNHAGESTKPLEETLAQVAKLIQGYDDAVAKALREAQEKARREAEEAAARAHAEQAMVMAATPFDDVPSPAPVPGPAPSYAPIATPQAKGSRKEIEVQAVDLALLPDAYKTITANLALIKNAIKQGTHVPGVTFTEVTKIV